MGRKAEIRLYVDTGLGPGQAVKLGGDVAHYLFSVMRRSPGDTVLVFNGRDGEWSATIVGGNRKGAELACDAKTRPQVSAPDLWLAFSPIRRARLEILVEKASEIGVSRLLPVLTEYTDKASFRADRMWTIAVEAVEQSRGLSIPEFAEPQALEALVSTWPEDRALIVADEAEEALRPHWPGAPAGIVIGPEGGFSQGERTMLQSHPAIHTVSLGPRTLRAETAAIVAVSRWHEAHS